MAFEVVDSISVAGNPDKANEDALADYKHAAVVLDGATGLGDSLMPGASDAAWLSNFGARRLMAHLREGAAPKTAVRNALADAEQSFKALRRREPQETYEIPFASMMLAVERKGGIDALSFGDCAGLVKRPDENVQIVGEAFEKRAKESERVGKVAAARGLAPAAGINRPEFLSALRAARNTVNTQKGGWLFGPDARASAHVKEMRVDAPQGTTVLLMTDGFLALASDYHAYDADQLVSAAISKGLKVLAEELRAIEADDPEGRTFPRFKKSDDATALLLRVI
jgi:hypothetical protein